MNIEDLVAAANPVRPADLPGSDSPAARRTLDLILVQAATAENGDQHHRSARRASWPGNRTLATLAFAATATTVAVAVLVSMAQGPAGRPTAASSRPVAAAPRASRSPSLPARRASAPPLSARQVLLTAAAHVSGGPAGAGPASGRYWRVTMVGGTTFPAGTTAHPYDITVLTSADQWNPRTPGDTEWVISRDLGARPASPADAAVWRAVGSPTSWHSGLPLRRVRTWDAGYPAGWVGTLAVTTSRSPTTASSWVSDGTVGYVEGNLAGLNAAQLAAMPTSERGVAKVLNDYYARTGCAQHSWCSPKDQIIWSEAVMLLLDPVSPQVRAATFRVMAGLRGVRTLGLMTDPLGRTGYALAPGGASPNSYPRNFNPRKVVLIDPQNGSLLATEQLGAVPATLRCLSMDSRGNCAGPAYVGRSYPDQVDDFVAVISERWTDADPPLPPPSRRAAALIGFPGLPPLPF